MNRDEISVRKTPFQFLKRLVVIEFFFALLPFLLVLLTNLRQSYEGSALGGTVSYNLLVAIGMTTLQVLIVGISLVAWYFPVYQIQQDKILLRRSNLFEDKVIAETQKITGIEVRQGRPRSQSRLWDAGHQQRGRGRESLISRTSPIRRPMRA